MPDKFSVSSKEIFIFNEEPPLGVRCTSPSPLFPPHPSLFPSPDTPFLFSIISYIPQHLPDPPPTPILYKCYWMMRVWRTTMVQGGYVTHKLYIPKSLWYDKRARRGEKAGTSEERWRGEQSRWRERNGEERDRERGRRGRR